MRGYLQSYPVGEKSDEQSCQRKNPPALVKEPDGHLHLQRNEKSFDTFVSCHVCGISEGENNTKPNRNPIHAPDILMNRNSEAPQRRKISFSSSLSCTSAWLTMFLTSNTSSMRVWPNSPHPPQKKNFSDEEEKTVKANQTSETSLIHTTDSHRHL